MFLFDVYSNIVCTLLTYSIFEKEYNRYCGCLDLKCKSCCKSLISDELQLTGLQLGVGSKSSTAEMTQTEDTGNTTKEEETHSI